MFSENMLYEVVFSCRYYMADSFPYLEVRFFSVANCNFLREKQRAKGDNSLQLQRNAHQPPAYLYPLNVFLKEDPIEQAYENKDMATSSELAGIWVLNHILEDS